MDPLTDFDRRIAIIHGLKNPHDTADRNFGESSMDTRHAEFEAMAHAFLGETFDRQKLNKVKKLQATLHKKQAVLYQRYENRKIGPEEYVDSVNALLDKTFAECESILGQEHFQKLFGAPRSELAGFIDKAAFLYAHQLGQHQPNADPEVNMMSEMNKLLKSELSAIETYQQALEKKGTDPAHIPAIDAMNAILDDHQRAASRIEAAIRQKGGEPVHSSGAWGTWSTIVIGTAQLFGDKAALKVLKEGEESGLKEYVDVLGDTGIPQDQKTLISDLLPTQRRHVQTLDGLRRILSRHRPGRDGQSGDP